MSDQWWETSGRTYACIPTVPIVHIHIGVCEAICEREGEAAGCVLPGRVMLVFLITPTYQ